MAAHCGPHPCTAYCQTHSLTLKQSNAVKLAVASSRVESRRVWLSRLSKLSCVREHGRVTLEPALSSIIYIHLDSLLNVIRGLNWITRRGGPPAPLFAFIQNICPASGLRTA